jgi:hypothetical protein
MVRCFSRGERGRRGERGWERGAEGGGRGTESGGRGEEEGGRGRGAEDGDGETAGVRRVDQLRWAIVAERNSNWSGAKACR